MAIVDPSAEFSDEDNGAQLPATRPEDEIVDAEIVERAERAAERRAEDVVRKLILELRQTNPAAPAVEDLRALDDVPEIRETYLELWKLDLDRRWEISRLQQDHEHSLEKRQLDLQEIELRGTLRILQVAPRFAIAFGIVALMVALVVAIVASPVAGAVIAGLDISTGIALFLYSKSRPGDTESSPDDSTA